MQLGSELSRPQASEIALNYPWILPIVRKFPSTVPSGFFLADTMLWLDRLLGGNMLTLGS